MKKIKAIYEDDFGCEERPLEQAKSVIVYIEDENGTQEKIRVPEEFIDKEKLAEGSVWKYETGEY